MQWLMLQQDEPKDYVIATGVQHSVREFVEAAASKLDMRLDWRGSGVDEKGYDADTGACIVAVDPRYYRPTEVETLLGDATRAKEELGWEPEISFDEMVEEMASEDLREAQREKLCLGNGFEVPLCHE
jgi:GDPmannose 4,6-dehydratase